MAFQIFPLIVPWEMQQQFSPKPRVQKYGQTTYSEKTKLTINPTKDYLTCNWTVDLATLATIEELLEAKQPMYVKLDETTPPKLYQCPKWSVQYHMMNCATLTCSFNRSFRLES